MLSEEKKQFISRNSKKIEEKLKHVEILIVLALIFLLGSITVLIFNKGSLNLFFDFVILLTAALALLLIVFAVMFTRHVEKTITGFIDESLVKTTHSELKRAYYASGLIIVATFFILTSITFFASILIILISVSFLYTIRNPEENEKWLKFLSSSPLIPFLILIVIIGTIISTDQSLGIFFPLLTELALTFVFLVFLVVSISKELFFEETMKNGKTILQEKIEEVFREKKCDFHQSMYKDKFCLNCKREVCSLCLLDFNNMCIYCFSDGLKTKALLFDSLIYLGIFLFTIYLISFIWGMYAPMPMISVFIEWLGLRYNRFTILFYYSVASFILLIVFSGGGYLASKQLKIKLKSLNKEFLMIES